MNEKERNKVMEVQSGRDAENTNIVMYAKNGKIHQQWNLVYASDWKPEPTKGQWNREFGFRVDKDFHIVSALPRGRFMDFLGRNLVIKVQNGRRS